MRSGEEPGTCIFYNVIPCVFYNVVPCSSCVYPPLITMPSRALSGASLHKKLVKVPGGGGKPSTVVHKDEGLSKYDPAKLKKLRPSFNKDGGTITAGNASSISDGVAALVLVSGQKVFGMGLQVIGNMSGYGDAAQAAWFRWWGVLLYFVRLMGWFKFSYKLEVARRLPSGLNFATWGSA
ncbi:acetyl-CoA acetyltransferase IA-like isoform X2 [Silene latifolia]|uniref:acetyl-CoA acetyltransferase IA-like isoform X2 n=1 Tax=Silene latifolia TaxID=37657 RepID=UPI003D777B42